MPHTRTALPATGALTFPDYRCAVAQAVVALDLHAPAPDDFRGVIGGHTSGDIQLLEIAASAHSVHRTFPLIQQGAQRYIKFTVVEEGNGLIVQDGRQSALGPGDMTLYDTGRPYSLIFGGDMRISVAMVPNELLSLPASVLERATASRLDGSSGLGAIVRPYISSLVRQAPDLDPHAVRRLSRNALDLMSTLLAAQPDACPPAGSHEALLRRILDYIDENLAAPDLSPPSIAAAHFVSVRHLHLLFSDQGTTVSNVIRNRRLERCYDELTDPLRAERSITSIALANGFVDPAHFSRTFRTHFGVAPSSLRPGGPGRRGEVAQPAARRRRA